MLVVKNLLANAGDVRDTGLIPGLGRSAGGGHGNRLQHSCLENPMERGAWWGKVHRVAESQTRLKRPGMHACCVSAGPLCCIYMMWWMRSTLHAWGRMFLSPSHTGFFWYLGSDGWGHQDHIHLKLKFLQNWGHAMCIQSLPEEFLEHSPSWRAHLFV